MGFPTKIQVIKRKASQQWYVSLPSALAQAMEFSRGETVEWFIESKAVLLLHRPSVPPSALEKNPPGSSGSGEKASTSSGGAELPTARKPTP